MADQPPQDAEASNVWSRRPRTDEGENDAAESQRLRMNPSALDLSLGKLQVDGIKGGFERNPRHE